MPKTIPALMMLRDPTTGHAKLVRYAKKLRGVRKSTELLEPRNLLTTVPLQFGAVYVEQDLGSDAHPDTIEISFVGGAPDTQLTQIEIDGDKFTPGISLADMIFDTVDAGLGVDLPFDGIIASREGDFGVEIFVEDGSSKLTLQFDGFDAGEKVTLAVDVDEVQGYDETETDLSLINEDLDPIASGAEFQGSQLTAYFSAPHYHDVEGTAEFRNRYDDNLEPTDLELPLDDEGENRDRTAGAVGQATQTPLPISISGRVYEDNDANLNQDASDEGLVDVELALFVEQDGVYVFTGHTVVTNTEGDYIFDTELGLLPGTYQIRESQPEDFVSVGAEIGNVAGQSTGTIETTDILSSISIPFGGTRATEYNFAETRLASIGGRVHLSSPEGDCWDESVEYEPVVGATILLLNTDGETIDETVTDENGNYEFFDLWPGEYTLFEVTPDNLFEGGARAGEVDGESRGVASRRQIGAISLFSGDDGDSFDFCDHPPASLGGTVYHDRDNDGVQDTDEEGIGEAILSLLDEDGLVVDTTETDENGHYEFVGLRAGNYRVIELQPDGWLDGKDRSGTANGRATGQAVNPGDAIEAISLLWGDQGIDFDFGELKPSSIEGRVHLSTRDGDCWDIDESLLEPVAGAVVQLMDATGQVLAEAVTAADGTYSFDELPPGEYGIRQITPEDLIDGGSRAGSVDGDPRGEVDSVGDIVGVTLNSDQAGTEYDFCEHKPSTISGFVYDDTNNDGIRDPNEAPIAGVIIQLFDENGNLIAETTTDENGQYTFEGLPPGNYSLRQIQPEDYLDGLDSVGTVDGEKRGRAINPGDQLIDITLGWGETGLEYNFGELRAASLSGMVHSSSDRNCWEHEDATPMAGVRISLLREDGRIVAETFTDAMGQYTFDGLAPGKYSVVEEQPVTAFDGTQRAGTSGGDATLPNQIVDVELSSGTDATNYDFCEKPPATISGFVFVDGEPIELKSDESLPEDVSPLRPGELSADDQRLPGVRLELRNGVTGEAIDAVVALEGYYDEGPIQTVTDLDGYYEFAGLPNGNYAVYELHPEGYFDGIDTPGTTDGIAINPLPFDEDDIFIESVISGLVVPPANDAIVRIGLPTGAHSQLNNFSEVLTRAIPDPPPTPPPVPPPTPTPPAPPEPPQLIPPLDPPPPAPLPPTVSPEDPDLYLRERELAENPLVDDSYINDGSHGAVASTWHLSVIDGGQPRVAHDDPETFLLFPISIWKQERLANARWEITYDDGKEESHYFGIENSIPVTGDFNGDGSTEIGVYYEGHWFIDLNGNGRWDADDLWAKLGHDGDLPVVGDWDGDGKDDIGIFGRAWPGDSIALRQEHGLPDMENVPDGARKNMPPEEDQEEIGRRVMKHTARGELREDVIDHVFLYGTSGDIGVVGDWNGDGIDTVGVFRAGEWQLDVDGNGRWTDPDESSAFGKLGDIPIVGDFDGDGIDDLAIIRNGKIYIDANGNRRLDVDDLVLEYDESKGLPVVGRWGMDGTDRIGQFKPYAAGRVTVASNSETE